MECPLQPILPAAILTAKPETSTIKKLKLHQLKLISRLSGNFTLEKELKEKN
jgi:hypothetical protein